MAGSPDLNWTRPATSLERRRSRSRARCWRRAGYPTMKSLAVRARSRVRCALNKYRFRDRTEVPFIRAGPATTGREIGQMRISGRQEGLPTLMPPSPPAGVAGRLAGWLTVGGDGDKSPLPNQPLRARHVGSTG